MKKLVLHTFTLFTIGLFIGCGSSSSEKNDAVNQDQGAVIDPEAKGGNTCLLGYQGKLGDLITPEMAQNATGLPAAEMEIKNNNKSSNQAYHNIEYRWKTDKTEKRTVGSMTLDIPKTYKVKLESIKERSFSNFKRNYAKATDKGLATADKAIEDALDKKSGNQEIDKQVDKLDKMGVDKADQKMVASSIGSVIGEIVKAYSDVEGLGDAASWNSVEEALYVLENGVQFQITLRVSEDGSTNKLKAIELAREILAKCD